MPQRSPEDELRSRRYRELNKRLNSLNSDIVQNYLLNEGFFPEDQFLPSDYFHATKLSGLGNAKKALYDQKGIFQAGNVDKNLGPTTFHFPKTRYTFRTLAVPPLKNHTLLSEFAGINWPMIQKHLVLSGGEKVVPYSLPMFYDGKKRSDVAINSHRIYFEYDIRALASYFDCIVFADIKNFYPSVYTHALAWALDDQTKGDNSDLNNPANQLDLLVRRQNANRSKGILIGPYTSDLVSEILLRRIDKDFGKAAKRQGLDRFFGARFKDDYIFLVNNKHEGEKLLKELQKVLDEYHLELNEQKTDILEDLHSEDTKLWKIETSAIRESIRSAQDKFKDKVKYPEKDLIFWLRKTRQLLAQYQDQYIVKTVLGSLVGVSKPVLISGPGLSVLPNKVHLGDVYSAVFSLLNDLCKQVPSAWPHFFVFIALCLEGAPKQTKAGYSETYIGISKYVYRLTDKFIEDENAFPLIWSLYVLWRSGDMEAIHVRKDKIKENFHDNWLVMSFIDESAQSEKVFSKNIQLVNKSNKNIKPLGELLNVFGYPIDIDIGNKD